MTGSLAVPSADVSVIVATYDHARYLGSAIESILAQTVGPREIIVIDDGSHDHPERVTSTYEGVSLIRQENAGLSAARNRGLEAAVGHYVIFLDADDRLLPTAVEKGLKCFEANPTCGMVYGTYHDIDESGRHLRARPLLRVGPDPFLDLLPGNLIGMHATVLYHRDRLVALGGFDQQLDACEDFDVFLRMARRYPIACHDAAVAEYRRLSSSMSGNAPRMLRAALTAVDKHRDTVRTNAARQADFAKARTNLKHHYARVQARAIRRLIRERKWSGPELKSLLRMFQIAPGALVRQLASQLTH